MSVQDSILVFGQVVVAARAVLAVIDVLDKSYPRLKPIGDFLGAVLGGKKERFTGTVAP